MSGEKDLDQLKREAAEKAKAAALAKRQAKAAGEARSPKQEDKPSEQALVQDEKPAMPKQLKHSTNSSSGNTCRS